MLFPTDFDQPEDPKPRLQLLPYHPIDWPVRNALKMHVPVNPPEAGFSSVLESRRSIRAISRAPLRETVNLLLYAHVQRFSWGDKPRRSMRPTHSAGALHPVELLLVAGHHRNRVFRIEPVDIALQSLRIVNPKPLISLGAKLIEILPNARSDYIVLLADRSLTASQYSSARNLIWRDAGALMQTLHLCATAFRMAFCPVGIGGAELGDAVFGPDHRFEAVGVAILGRPV